MKKNGLISLSLSFSVVMGCSITYVSAKTTNGTHDEALAYIDNAIEQIPVSAIDMAYVDSSISTNQLALLQPTSGLLYPSDVLAAEAEAKRQLQAEATLPLSLAQPLLAQDNTHQPVATTPTHSSDPAWQAYAPSYRDHEDAFRQVTYLPTYYPSPSAYYSPYYLPYYGTNYGANYGSGRYSGGYSGSYLGAYYPYRPYTYNKGVVQPRQSMMLPSLGYGYQRYNMTSPQASYVPQSGIKGALPFPFPPVHYGASTGGTQTIAPHTDQPLTTPQVTHTKPAQAAGNAQAASNYAGQWVRPPQYPSEMFTQGVSQTEAPPQPTLHPEFQQLKAELAALKNQLNQANQYLDALKAANQQLREEKTRLSQQFAQQQYRAQTCEQAHKQACKQEIAKQIEDKNSSEQTRLHEQLASTEQALSAEQQKADRLDEEKAALRKQLDESQQALAALSTQQLQEKTNKSGLEAQLAKLIQEKAQAIQDKASVEQQLAMLIQEKEQAIQDKADTEQQLAAFIQEKEQVAQGQTAIEQQLAKLTQEKEQAVQDKATTEQRLAKLIQEKEQAAQGHNTVEQALTQTKTLLTAEKESYQELQIQYEALVQEKTASREQISRLQQALLLANQQSDHENQQKQALAQQYDTVKSSLAQSALALTACQTHQARDSEAQQQRFAAQQQLEQQLVEYEQRNQSLNTANMRLQQENDQYQQSIEALEQANQQAQATLATMPHDHDQDAVIDSKDQCPNTPESTTVDISGCEADQDQDGVSDSKDQCPNTLAQVRVDEQGCEPDQDADGIVDRIDDCPLSAPLAKVNEQGCLPDRDGDGVIDVRDQCPDSPQDSEVDTKGCELDRDQDSMMDTDLMDSDEDDKQAAPAPAVNTNDTDLIDNNKNGDISAADLIEAEKEDESSENQPLTDVTENSPETDDLPDTDQDGIPDSADLCPNSQVSEKTRMDQLGCEKGMTIKLEGVNFEKGSATLTAVSLPILEQTLTVLKNVPEITLEVGGYTDSKGNEQSNLQLSQRRAEAVQQYFLAQGLSANHVLAKGYGEAQAIADNNTAEGRAKNRRVELKVLD